MEIVKVNDKAFVKINKNFSTDFAVTKNRPVQSLDDTLYRFTSGYECILDREELLSIRQKTFNGNTCTYVTCSRLLKYLSTKYFDNKRVFTARQFYNTYPLSRDNLTMEKLPIYIEGEWELVTTKTKRDQAIIDLANKKTVNQKLVKTFFYNNLEAICDKYGMSFTENTIKFKDAASFETFLFKALENTIGKDLEEIHIVPKYIINKRGKTRHFYDTLIDLTKSDFNVDELE